MSLDFTLEKSVFQSVEIPDEPRNRIFTGMRVLSVLCVLFLIHHGASGLELVHTIRGNIAPKSVGYSACGLIFAQNMMYRHSITVYDRQFRLVKTIPDVVELSKFGYAKYKGFYRGSPVEVTFTDSGKSAWVSNYFMSGRGFVNPGNDSCSDGRNRDFSFVYQIDTKALAVVGVAPAGSVPKYLAGTPDSRYVLVSNWCSGDVSVIDAARDKEIRRIRVGRFPRGIVVDSASSTAYIAVMGSYDIAVLHLKDFSLTYLRGVGRSPRHLVIDPRGAFLYATLNGEGRVAKVDLFGGRPVQRVNTGQAPRSMTISSDGKYLYVTNYFSDTVSKVRTADMHVEQEVKTEHHPIGITYDPVSKRVWVACYTGSIMVFQD